LNSNIRELDGFAVDRDGTGENNGRYRLTEDGQWQVKKSVPTVFGTRDAYFPCLQDDPDEFYRLAFFGGIIGVHRYKGGQVMQGILYTLTFGMGGVLYLCDLLAMLLGSYLVQHTVYVMDPDTQCIRKLVQKQYLGPLGNRRRAAVLFVLAFAVAGLAVTFVYRPLATAAGQALSGLASSAAQDIFRDM
jgi:hypothetical protein